eukprot:4698141-Amphidinium_carterae.1
MMVRYTCDYKCSVDTFCSTLRHICCLTDAAGCQSIEAFQRQTGLQLWRPHHGQLLMIIGNPDQVQGLKSLDPDRQNFSALQSKVNSMHGSSKLHESMLAQN